MKILRRVTQILFVFTLCAFLGFTFHAKKTVDMTYPVIKVPSAQIEVSIASAEEELLRDVTAYDEKDGDLTDSIIIESFSQFIDNGVYTVTYAVADSDCHVSKASRTVRYTDYTSPKFYLTRPLVFNVGEKVDFKNVVGAVDCLDGDISDKVTFLASDYTSTTAGVYTLSVQATNSRGDMIYMDLPVYVEQNSQLAPKISLKKAIMYAPKGMEFDWNVYVAGVTNNGKPAEDYKVEISTDYDSNTPGMYSVHYYVTNDSGYTGHMILTVVVEE